MDRADLEKKHPDGIWCWPKEVELGDVMIGYDYGGVYEVSRLAGYTTEVKCINTQRGGSNNWIGNRNTLNVDPERDSIQWFVRRARRAATKNIADYPHTCTRCGRSCYLGAWEVTHLDEVAAKDCPARRK